jgi:hypothetical protein
VQSNPGFTTGDFTNFDPIEIPIGAGRANLTVNSIWDDTDLTYVLRGSIVLDGYYGLSSFFVNPEPLPNATQFDVEQRPFIVLTIQASLPDTLLADGSRIARPGETVLVKLLNDYIPSTIGPGTPVDPALDNPAANTTQATNVGAGFVVGVDDGIPPGTGSPTIDPGVGSQIRIVGIGSNETTGQQRVPAIITSLRDASAGKTVRGVDMFDIFRNDNRNRFTGAALRTPANNDGGKIYFGGNSLTDYNLYDPRNGNLIDNADLRFLHRIEIQGGGIVDVEDINNDLAITFGDNYRQQKVGSTR